MSLKAHKRRNPRWRFIAWAEPAAENVILALFGGPSSLLRYPAPSWKCRLNLQVEGLMFELSRRFPVVLTVPVLLCVLGSQPVFAQSGIHVMSGTYGGNCGQSVGNVTDQLASACNGKSSCEYSVDYKVIGDRAPGCQKDYVAKWTCDGGGEQTARADAEAGYGSRVALTCINRGALTGRFTGADIVDGSIKGIDIGDNTVTGGNIKDGSIEGKDIAIGTITGDKIANDAITTASIQDGSIKGEDIAIGTVTGDKIANDAITTASISRRLDQRRRHW